jgi:hypothetical protein
MNKKILRNLLNMMQSSDEDNHYMAMQAIVNLGPPNIVEVIYKEELLFLWVYGRPHLEDWAIVKPEVTKMFRNICTKYRPKGSLTMSKQDLKYKERWLGHLIGPNARVKKPWVAELIIEEIINEKKRIFNALDFKYKDIQIKITQ